MLRITPDHRSHRPLRLKLAGDLSTDAVALLASELDRWWPQHSELVLDLNGVLFIDEQGLALLRKWAAQGLAFQGGSWFIRTLLKAYGLDAG